MAQQLKATHQRERIELPRAAREYLDSGAPPPSRDGLPRRFRPVTFIWFVAFAASLVGAFVLDDDGLVVLAALASFVFFFVALVALLNDARTPDPGDRSTPEQAVRCWGQALRFGHFRKAYSCHHPDLLPDRLQLDPMPTLRVSGWPHSVSSYEGFQTLWRSVLGSSDGTNRVVKKVLIGDMIEQGKVAECEVMFKVVRFGSWVYVGLVLGVLPVLLLYWADRRVAMVRTQVQLIRHGDQWWVLPPVPHESPHSEPADRLPRASVL